MQSVALDWFQSYLTARQQENNSSEFGVYLYQQNIPHEISANTNRQTTNNNSTINQTEELQGSGVERKLCVVEILCLPVLREVKFAAFQENQSIKNINNTVSGNHLGRNNIKHVTGKVEQLPALIRLN